MKTKEGFTLAEVLITLGIIGIVAAMTLPTLISNYQKVVLETAYKKGLSVVANAVQMAMAQNETPGDFASTPIVGCYNAYVASMNNTDTDEEIVTVTLQDCIAQYNSKLFAVILDSGDNDLYNILYNLEYGKTENYISSIFFPPAYAAAALFWPDYIWSSSIFSFMAADGIVLGYSTPVTSYDSNTGNTFVNGFYMLMDVNGAKRPNVKGKDLFLIGINRHGKVIDVTCEFFNNCSREIRDMLRH